MKNYRFNVLTIREYIVRNGLVDAIDEWDARRKIWSYLIATKKLSSNLFYKVELFVNEKEEKL